MKRKPSPFDPIPNAWPEVAIVIIALIFLAYGAWIMWPVVTSAWLFLTW